MAHPVMTRRLRLESHLLPLQHHHQAVGHPLQPAHPMTHLPALKTRHPVLMTHHRHHPVLVPHHPVQTMIPPNQAVTVR